MFNSSTVILQAVSDTLQAGGTSSLAAQWTNIANQAQSLAYGYIVRELVKRGYTIDQITAWDFGADYELNIAVFFALQRGGALANVSGAFLATFDLRKDIAEVMVTIGGVATYPAGDAGLVGQGRESTANDVFVWPNPGSEQDSPGPGIGAPTDPW